MRNKWLILSVVGALGLGFGLSACGGDDDDDDADDTEATADGDDGAAGSPAVTAENTAFAVNSSVTAGADFTVDNLDGTTHTFTADDGAFDAELSGDSTVTVTAPAEAGDYAFHCEIHPSMTGMLTVQ